MKMTRLLTTFISGLLLSVSSVVNADYCCPMWYDGICPFAGADIKWVRTPGKRDWKPEYPAQYLGGNLYGGIKFHENLGLELGYEGFQRKTRHHATGPFYRFFRLPFGSVNYKRTVQFQTWHADLNYYVALIHDFDFFASLGWGLIRTRMTTVPIQPPTTLLQAAVINGRLGTRAIFRGRLGLQYHLNPTWALRGFIGFDNTAKITVMQRAQEILLRRTVIPNRVFRDSISVSFGVFAKIPYLLETVCSLN